MNKHLRSAAAAFTTAALMGSALAMSGPANANGLTEVLEEIGKAVARSGVHTPPPKLPLVPRPLTRKPPPELITAEDVLRPSINAARENPTTFEVIRNGACRVNSAVKWGQRVDNILVDYSEWEQNEIRAQADWLLGYDPQLVSIFCKATRPTR